MSKARNIQKRICLQIEISRCSKCGIGTNICGLKYVFIFLSLTVYMLSDLKKSLTQAVSN